MLIPILTGLHILSIVTYMYVGYPDSQAWSTYFYVSEKLFLGLFLVIISSIKYRSYLDEQILGVHGTYIILLGISYLNSDYNMLPFFPNFNQVATTGKFYCIASLIVTINLIRYGFFKNQDRHDASRES